jgi:hypothetical protein
MSRRCTKLSELDPIDGSDAINVVVETSRGARTKLAYDGRREAFVVKQVLPQGPCRLIGVIDSSKEATALEAHAESRGTSAGSGRTAI